MTKIGIIGAETGALLSEVLRMAEEANIEIVELDKDFSPTDIPQFEDRVYTIQPRPELPHIEWCEPVRFCPYNDKKHPKRKPNPGMLEDMLAEFTHNTGITIAKEDCLMIGDASGLEGQFSDSDLKTAENFGCDYLDVTEFTNMELPEPLFKVIRLSDGEVVKDKDDNPLQNLTESEATDKVVFLMEANPEPQEQFTYVPMLWEVPHEPEQAPQPKEKIIHMNPKKQ